MNARIETRFVATLRAILPLLAIREATSHEPLPKEGQLLFVECAQLEHVAGPLHRAMMRFILVTNAHDLSAQAHSQSSQLLFSALHNAPLIHTRFNTGSPGGMELRGVHTRLWSEQTEDNAWRTPAELTAGIAVG